MRQRAEPHAQTRREAERVAQRGGPRIERRPLAVQRTHDGEVLRNGELVEPVRLVRDVRELSARRATAFHPVDDDRPGARAHEPDDGAQRRALAAAVRAEQADDRARRNVERNVRHRANRAVADVETLDDEGDDRAHAGRADGRPPFPARVSSGIRP